MPTPDTLPTRIVDEAIELAERSSWEAVRLHDVAAGLGVSLEEVRAHFREKGEVAEAWFDRADAAMLAESEAVGFYELSARERLHRLIMARLGALAPHRRVTRQMIRGKLEPGHLHLQLPALARISRTVQWLREAAHRDATHLRRALEETGLTAIYLVAFCRWLRDDSPDASHTRRLLDRDLACAEWLDRTLYGRRAVHEPQVPERPPASPQPPAPKPAL